MPDMWMDVDAALSEVPVNIFPLTDDGDFKTREEAVTFDQAGMDLVWNFTTTAGAMTQTAVTPTNGGDYDWANQGNAMYSIEMPAAGGASINNDTEGVGWFVGYATGVLPWRGPTIGFRAAALNNALIDGGDSLDVNVTEVSGDSAAADTLEEIIEGTELLTTDISVVGQLAITNIMTLQMTVNNLDHLCAVATAGADMTAEVVDGSIISRILANGDTSIFDPSTDGLQPIRDQIVTVDGIVDNILLDTGTDGVLLAIDSIKAVTFDETTAWPLKADDAGATQIARVGADGDTLETLSDQIDDVPTVAEFNARTLVAASYFDPATDAVVNVTNVTGSVAGNVDGNVGGNVTGSVGSVLGAINATAGVITTLDGLDTAQDAQHLITQNAVALVPTASENADEVLGYDLGSVTGPASRSLLNSLRFLRNKWTIAGNTLTVYEEDDIAVAWTATIATAAGNPVNEIDPA